MKGSHRIQILMNQNAQSIRFEVIVGCCVQSFPLLYLKALENKCYLLCTLTSDDDATRLMTAKACAKTLTTYQRLHTWSCFRFERIHLIFNKRYTHTCEL